MTPGSGAGPTLSPSHEATLAAALDSTLKKDEVQHRFDDFEYEHPNETSSESITPLSLSNQFDSLPVASPKKPHLAFNSVPFNLSRATEELFSTLDKNKNRTPFCYLSCQAEVCGRKLLATYSSDNTNSSYSEINGGIRMNLEVKVDKIKWTDVTQVVFEDEIPCFTIQAGKPKVFAFHEALRPRVCDAVNGKDYVVRSIFKAADGVAWSVLWLPKDYEPDQLLEAAAAQLAERWTFRDTEDKAKVVTESHKFSPELRNRFVAIYRPGMEPFIADVPLLAFAEARRNALLVDAGSQDLAYKTNGVLNIGLLKNHLLMPLIQEAIETDLDSQLYSKAAFGGIGGRFHKFVAIFQFFKVGVNTQLVWDDIYPTLSSDLTPPLPVTADKFGGASAHGYHRFPLVPHLLPKDIVCATWIAGIAHHGEADGTALALYEVKQTRQGIFVDCHSAYLVVEKNKIPEEILLHVLRALEGPLRWRFGLKVRLGRTELQSFLTVTGGMAPILSREAIFPYHSNLVTFIDSNPHYLFFSELKRKIQEMSKQALISRKEGLFILKELIQDHSDKREDSIRTYSFAREADAAAASVEQNLQTSNQAYKAARAQPLAGVPSRRGRPAARS